MLCACLLKFAWLVLVAFSWCATWAASVEKSALPLAEAPLTLSALGVMFGGFCDGQGVCESGTFCVQFGSCLRSNQCSRCYPWAPARCSATCAARYAYRRLSLRNWCGGIEREKAHQYCNMWYGTAMCNCLNNLNQQNTGPETLCIHLRNC